MSVTDEQRILTIKSLPFIASLYGTQLLLHKLLYKLKDEDNFVEIN